MEQITLKKQRVLKCKKTIAMLSLISLICTFLSCITYFVDYDKIYYNRYKLVIEFPNILNLLSITIALAPCILLVLYIFKFHGEFKAAGIIPLIFGLIAIQALYNSVKNIFLGYSFNFFIFIDLILDIVIIVAFTIAVINAMNGFSNKALLIIPIAIGLIVEIILNIDIFEEIKWYFQEELYIYIFTRLADVVGSITLYIALLLFGIYNRTYDAFSVFTKKEKNAKELSPEQSLRILKYKLDNGIITEEEYKKERQEIISTL